MLRFGAFVPQGWRMELANVPVEEHWETMSDIARELEALGFESGWVFDHFHTIPVPSQEVTYEAWAMMAALAVATDTLRLGQMCTCNGYRPPTYLAKAAASIDVISGGRLEMGIGAGWYEHEFKGYGYPFPKPSVRLGQLDEAVQIMRSMWTEKTVSFDGKHYQLDGAICQPKPVQDPYIPLWVAGGGEQLTLRTAARYADYANFGIDLEAFRHKSQVLAAHCRDADRNFDEIVRSSNFTVAIAPTEEQVEDRFGWLGSFYQDLEVPEENWRRQVQFMRNGLAGTPAQIIEELEAWQEAGMTYPILFFPEVPYDRSGIELFAREVIPAFQ